MEGFVKVCRGRGLKIIVEKSKVMVLGSEEELEHRTHVDGTRFGQVSEFKYLGFGLEESGTDVDECRRKVASGRKVAGTIRSLVNARDLKHECGRVFHEALLMPVLLYGSETMICIEKEKYRARDEQMDNLRELLGVR